MTIVILDVRDETELTTVVAFVANWLGADVDHARHRLPLRGATLEATQ